MPSSSSSSSFGLPPTRLVQTRGANGGKDVGRGSEASPCKAVDGTRDAPGRLGGEASEAGTVEEEEEEEEEAGRDVSDARFDAGRGGKGGPREG